jgi:Zn-dependent M28 family amino/carboxypeptidase
VDTFDGTKPGSDDDGSGVANAMETYHAILESGMTFKRDIYFAYYAAEERGLVGSSFVVSHFVKNKIAVRGAIQFDMTGFKSKDDTYDIFLITDHADQAREPPTLPGRLEGHQHSRERSPGLALRLLQGEARRAHLSGHWRELGHIPRR